MWRIEIQIVMLGRAVIYVHGFENDKLTAEGKARHYGNYASPSGNGTKIIKSTWVEQIVENKTSAFGEIEV